MDFVACDGVGDCAHAYLVIVGDAAAGPGCLVEIPKKSQRGATYGDVFLDQFGQKTIGEGTVADVVVLFESFDGSAIAAADAECAIGEDAFGIADVAENFFDRPFVGSVAEVASESSCPERRSNIWRRCVSSVPRMSAPGTREM